MDIQDFEARMHPDEFLEWLNTVERVFEFFDPLKHKKVKIVAVKLHKNASFWWEDLEEAAGKRR